MIDAHVSYAYSFLKELIKSVKAEKRAVHRGGIFIPNRIDARA